MMEKHGSPAFFGVCTFGGGVRGVKQPDLKKSSELLILIEGVCMDPNTLWKFEFLL